MEDLIVDDKFYQEMEQFFYRTGMAIEDNILHLCEMMEKASQESLIEGETAEAFKIYSMAVEELKGQAKSVCDEAAQLMSGFVKDIDGVDQKLY